MKGANKMAKKIIAELSNDEYSVFSVLFTIGAQNFFNSCEDILNITDEPITKDFLEAYTLDRQIVINTLSQKFGIDL